MAQKIREKIQAKDSRLVLLVLAFVIFCLLNIHLRAAAAPIIPNPNSNLISGGYLSGGSYLTNDSSAYSGVKVSFGNPNSVTFSYPKNMSANTTISSGNLSKSSPISRLDFGANAIWYDGGYGTQNLSNNQLYAGVVDLTKDIGISVLRYPGGIPSDTFNWQDAIGPQSSRSDNVVYQDQDTFLPSSFGPNEFGQLLSDVKADGDITVNFGTGTAEQASTWVQYMTSSSKSNSWAALRSKNGHSAAFNIPYWEVGNEQQASAGELYWRSGSLVSIGHNKRSQCASVSIYLCEYVYGGTTAFTKQAALASNNSSAGSGQANQIFFAKYPPLVVNSQVVYVNGQAWKATNNLDQSAQNQRVYQINDTTGQIKFGGGSHGLAVPAGASVTISYQSGPHDGFVDYYKLMKQANPNIKVCSAYDSADFIKLMGSTLPYDCLVTHLYAGQVPSGNSSAVLFHDSLIEQSFGFAGIISNEQSEINQYAGKQAKSIQLVVTEYGVNALTSPQGQPNYHRSLDMALFEANALRIMIDCHIPLAEKHYLISYEFAAPPGPLIYVNSGTFADNALIGGPGPNPVLEPSALAMEAYTKLLYSNLISSHVSNNPELVDGGYSFSSLTTLATTDKSGHEAMMIMNLTPSQTIKAAVVPSLSNYTQVNSWTLGANSYLAYNTPSDPSSVGFVKKTARLKQGRLVASFPPSSITVLQFK